MQYDSAMLIGVITNPNSRGNRRKPKRVSDLQAVVGNSGYVHQTESTDSIKPILRDFLRKDVRYWVADGGDGAFHWMISNGFEVLSEEEFANRDLQLPMAIPTGAGTMNVVQKNVGISGDAEQILSNLRSVTEAGQTIPEALVETMKFSGKRLTENGVKQFVSYGFAAAIGGIGQRFFNKFYESPDPNPYTMLKVSAKTLSSLPFSSLRQASPGITSVPLLSKALDKLSGYADDVFKPTSARIAIDGEVLEHDRFTGIHVASLSVNIGGIFRLFTQAGRPGFMNCILGAPSPVTIAKNVGNMYLGRKIRGESIHDSQCQTLSVSVNPENGEELLAPVIDGETYKDIIEINFEIGPQIRIPRISG